MTAQHRFRYLTCCVDSTAEAIEAMTAGAREITWRTFARQTDWRPLAERLGYQRAGLTLSGDYHVRFFKGDYRGSPCYYLLHSAIEFIFTPQRGDTYETDQ